MAENLINNLTVDFFFISVLSYLVGSIPFGLIFTRIAGLGDIRSIGSGNLGATNVLRTGNKTLALLTLLSDAGKGGAIIIFTQHFYSDDNSFIPFIILSGILLVLGHNFPVWLRFKGGKGIATTLGILIAANWIVGIAACLTWLIIALLFRYSSLAALIAIITSPIYAWHLNDTNLVILTGIFVILAFFQHRENIIRLVKGNENKINLGKNRN
ncbi:MAG: acyl-phosphate glycerol 3-phosphate acyltransferase [Rhodospirillaceae bacterium]|nr:acyl-phosphate glycerol 3-phosphate acyltransferase [Rhodospirillaceae bacterium]OUT76999.1 MAG: acyl-phosphate glycerol 3-phosphate acyltransferase [Rhodospirillaceae bacterium TMED23]|tara:strand:+ start:6572 stop:7210 length:639 start_codon:yes stop_codon:yes gene_type:complete